MPSHHHQHHHHRTNHHQPQISINQCSSCCSGGSCCCCSSEYSPPPPLPTSDQLLQGLTNHLLLLQSPPTPQHLHSHHYLKSQLQHHPPPQRTHLSRDQQQTQSLLQSLLRRVAALESSLPNLSSSAPSRPPSSSPAPPRLSLRDLAARTIQSRFRLFLVRRSETLRHLKRLAAIKSHAAALRSSLSDKTHLDPKALSQKAMDLLLQLDSIKSGDPMIREGKRSISRELFRISEFVEKVLVKERQLSLKTMEVSENVSNGRASVEDDEVPYMKPAKRVSFAASGKETRISVNSPEAVSEEAMGMQRWMREAEGIGGFARVYEEDGEDTHLRSLGFYQFSDGEESPRATAEGGGRYGIDGSFQGQNGNLGLYAPMPVKMEETRRSGAWKKVSSP